MHFSGPFPSPICLNIPHNWASVEQTRTSVLVQRELSHFDRKTVHPEIFLLRLQLVPFPLYFLSFFFMCVCRGVEAVLLLSISTLSPVHTVQLILYPPCLAVKHSSHRIWSKLFLFLLVDSETSESLSYSHKDVKEFLWPAAIWCCIHGHKGQWGCFVFY